MATTAEAYHEGQDVYFVHPVESWIKGTVKEVVHTKLKSGAIEVSYTCQGTGEKTLLPNITGAAAVVAKLPPQSLHQVVYTGATDSGGTDLKAVTFDPEGRDTFSDLLDLSYLHDSTLLEQVRKRYFANLIYTRIGPIVLALNPYDYSLPNYVDSNMPTYIAEGSAIVANAGKSTLIPHAWSTAHYAYWLLSIGESNMNQSVIVSGESGAGKTETAKIVVKYLGKVSTSVCSDEVREAATQVTARVNLTSPILEAFGNAKTSRNDNSSRFGKFMKVHFDLGNRGAGGVMVGVSIDVYLLEKSRVVTHGPGERAYHCFYQLLAKANGGKTAGKQTLLKDLHLGAAADYASLNVGNAIDIPGVDDGNDWQDVVDAMYAVGLSKDEEGSVWKVIATVLHLLDVKVSALNHDECEIEGVDALGAAAGTSPGRRPRAQSMAPGRDVPNADRASRNAAHMAAIKEIIGVDMNAFAAELITTKSFIQGETIVRKLKKAAAIDVKDAICKFMYEALFLWLVDKINGLISPPPEAKDTWIALLDIFGFENFEHNSFEQMCINLANETLQNHYNSVVFTRDMAECHSEGINTASVTFYDNQPCLDMVCGVNFSMCGLPTQKGSIVTSKLSITSLLDDESSLGNGSDLAFCSKLDDAFGAKGPKAAHPNFDKPKTQNNAFVIKHYAGDVKYTVEGFRSKNADTTKDTLKELLLTSPNAFVAGLVTHYQKVQAEAQAQSQSAGTGLKNSNTVSSFFKNQLVRLMTEINRTHPHWIRCVKPHSAKKPRMFCGEEVMNQMRSAGVLETVRIRQQSFSIRLPFAEFLSGAARLFLKRVPSHTVNLLAQRSAALNAAAADAKAALDFATQSKATPGKLKELTTKLEVAQLAASSLGTVVAEMKTSNGNALSGPPSDQCMAILRRCGVDSHELAQVGTTKVFMRAPAFQQLNKQETEIRSSLASILTAHARAHDSNSRVRCLQLNHYVRLIGASLVARASAVAMRKKELVVTERDLVTRFRDLLLKESEESKVRAHLLEEEAGAFANIMSHQANEMKELMAEWLAAMAEKHASQRGKLNEDESTARSLTIEAAEARERLVLSQLLTIFDDEAERRLELEAEEEDCREATLDAEAAQINEEVREARILAATNALRACEVRYDSVRIEITRGAIAAYAFLLSSEALQLKEINARSGIIEASSEEWDRDVLYEHQRGWEKLKVLWHEQHASRCAKLMRLLLRHETSGRAAIEVEYEQYLIAIYNRVEDSIEEALDMEAARLEHEAKHQRMMARERQRAEQERHDRWVNEQREIAKAIWSAAKAVEDEIKAAERAKQRGFELRMQEAQQVRDRIRAQQEREVLARAKGVASVKAPGSTVIALPKRPSGSFGLSPQMAGLMGGSSLTPQRSGQSGRTEGSFSPPAAAAAHMTSPSPSAPLGLMDSTSDLNTMSSASNMKPSPSLGGTLAAAPSANDKFRLLMHNLEAVGSSDLTPRSKRTLTLQLVRGTNETARAASPPAYEPDFVDPTTVSTTARNGGVPLGDGMLEQAHKKLIIRYEEGESPLGRYRDRRVGDDSHQGSRYLGSSQSRSSAGLASFDDFAKETPSLYSLARKGIVVASTNARPVHKTLTPSVFHKVSINPFDSTWEPVAGGTKAYLPDGSLVDIA